MEIIPSETFSDINKTSFPALNANISKLPFDLKLESPFISNASVIIKPLKPKSFFKSSVTIEYDKVDGRPIVFSRLGTSKCAIITLSKPLLIKFLKGFNSTFKILSFLCLIIGKVLCESVLVSPCPGKCFALDKTFISS
ncbi:MAG: Uncharacterised protein [Flavobacteriaceae bacterium]|nr:MAG: Uncharacterised protein [Flavobacteriaceae bacterium]